MTIARATAASAAATAMIRIGKTVAGRVALEEEAVEGDEIQRRGVEDQLDAEQHRDQVAPGEHAVDAEGEEQRREDQVVLESGVHQSSSFLV